MFEDPSVFVLEHGEIILMMSSLLFCADDTCGDMFYFDQKHVDLLTCETPARCHHENTQTAQTARVFLHLSFLSQQYVSKVKTSTFLSSYHTYRARQSLCGSVVTQEIHLSQALSPQFNGSQKVTDKKRPNHAFTPIPLGGNLSRGTMSSSLSALPSVPSHQFDDIGNFESARRDPMQTHCMDQRDIKTLSQRT